ncbi:MAG: hypothetical protein ACOYMN_08155, partial [Roseimicrobium sp.]
MSHVPSAATCAEAEHPTLSAEAFAQVFPFFLAWDAAGRVTSVGPTLPKICPDTGVGARLADLFEITRPPGCKSIEQLVASSAKLILLRHRASGLSLRGQVLPRGSQGAGVLIATPWITEPGQAAHLGLTLSDFAIHDQTLD